MVKVKATKQLWKGVFNYAHSIHILYCYSTSERGAWRNFCYQLAKKHEIEVGWVMNMFGGCSDNHAITIEKGGSE